MDSSLYKGSIETIIIKLLTSEVKMYGYQITQRIKEISAEEIILKEGSLYPLLHKMESKGIISSELIEVGNRMRKYYFLTQEGNNRSEEYISEMEKYIQLMKQILNPINT